MAAAPRQPAAAGLPHGGCPVPPTQEAPGGQDRMQPRAYPVPGRTCAWNASGIKMLATGEDHEGGLHPCANTRQGWTSRDASHIKAMGRRNRRARCNRCRTPYGQNIRTRLPIGGEMISGLARWVLPFMMFKGGGHIALERRCELTTRATLPPCFRSLPRERRTSPCVFGAGIAKLPQYVNNLGEWAGRGISLGTRRPAGEPTLPPAHEVPSSKPGALGHNHARPLALLPHRATSGRSGHVFYGQWGGITARFGSCPRSKRGNRARRMQRAPGFPGAASHGRCEGKVGRYPPAESNGLE
jgi:hypothetical protein